MGVVRRLAAAGFRVRLTISVLAAIAVSGCVGANYSQYERDDRGRLVKAATEAASQRAREPRPTAETSHQKIGRPYQIKGVWYVPARQDDYRERGEASWYGGQFHGRKTANGEVFDMNRLSAAHPTLPLPSLVRVVNLDNKRSIVVRVNDRGPFANGRIIDLSRAAADALGFRGKGVANVEVSYVGPAPASAKAASPADQFVERPRVRQLASRSSGVYVQAAAFSQSSRASAAKTELRSAGDVKIERASVRGRTMHRVLVGPWPDSAAAEDARMTVAAAGFPAAHVVRR